MLSERTPRRRAPLFLLAGGLSLGVAGCAGLVPAPSPAAAPPSSSSSSSSSALADPERLRAGLRHLEDSLVLDLLLGYRLRELGLADSGIEHRARSAQHQLSYMLRHGGVKEHGGEGAVIRPGPGEPVTLRDAVDQMSEALLRHDAGAAWRPETDRAREVQRHRPALSKLVEDAEWVLTLATALESPLPEADKQRLRELHEAYVAEAPHDEVAARAQTLLASVPDERLRREIKKLANRSWERERRARTAPRRESAVSVPAAPTVPPAPPATPPPSAPLPAAPAFPAPPSSPPPVPSGEPEPSASVDDPADALTTPERYCANRRAEAAQAFAAARGATDAAEKERLLKQSLESLDDCLARHPDTPEAGKARQNRTRVEQELAR